MKQLITCHPDLQRVFLRIVGSADSGAALCAVELPEISLVANGAVPATLSMCMRVGNQGVAAKALIATSLLRGRVNSTKDVGATGYWFKVRRVHTGRISTQVVQLQTDRDRPDKDFVSEPVGANTPPSATRFDVGAAISETIGRAVPRPAFSRRECRSNRPQAPFKVSSLSHARSICAGTA